MMTTTETRRQNRCLAFGRLLPEASTTSKVKRGILLRFQRLADHSQGEYE